VAAVDFVVVTVLLFGVFVSIGVAKYLLGSNSIDLPKTGVLQTGTGWPAVEFLYLWIAWSLTGRSFGKQLFGLRAIQGDGARLGWLRSGARALWCTVFGIPSLLWAGVSSRNAAVHDIVLRTAVVYDWSHGSEAEVPLPPVATEAPAPQAPALSEV
jgi:uncharacterized RDD family membrane protein YckC